MNGRFWRLRVCFARIPMNTCSLDTAHIPTNRSQMRGMSVETMLIHVLASKYPIDLIASQRAKRAEKSFDEFDVQTISISIVLASESCFNPTWYQLTSIIPSLKPSLTTCKIPFLYVIFFSSRSTPNTWYYHLHPLMLFIFPADATSFEDDLSIGKNVLLICPASGIPGSLSTLYLISMPVKDLVNNFLIVDCEDILINSPLLWRCVFLDSTKSAFRIGALSGNDCGHCIGVDWSHVIQLCCLGCEVILNNAKSIDLEEPLHFKMLK